MIKLKKATQKDKKDVLRIIFSSLKKTVAPFYSFDYASRIKGVYEKRVEKYIDEGALSLIKAGDKTVGTIGLVADEVKTLFIDPLYQGFGYGKKALLKLELMARKIGHTVLHLDALVNAVGFYLKQGFSITKKVVKKAEYDASLEYPVTKMRKELQ